jgi:hypothetical protein
MAIPATNGLFQQGEAYSPPPKSPAASKPEVINGVDATEK